MTLGIGVDTGGTHTDVVLVDPATAVFLTLKVATTPGDLGDGIVEGIARALVEAGRDPGEVGRLVYGTTVVTNLIVEGREGGVGLITTKGFRDVLAIARASRKENVYDIHWRPPRPLVSRRLRRGVPERVDHQGRVHLPLDEDATRDAIRSLAAAGVESLAICLLNAYANPVHEERIAEIAEEEAPNLTLSLSSRVVREFREYERTSTTAMNAFVARPLARHLRDLERRLADRGLTVPPAIMRSNGGLMTFRGAQSLPVALTHSGPMGGIVGGAAIAEACGIANAITLDMGGTSADVALIRDGRPLATTRGKLGAHAVLLPMLDLVTIGAGGGSVAWLDAGGSLKVGPRSAGAEPGPACYGQGGTEPTVTDANLVCGRLNDSYFLAGARRLRADLAERLIPLAPVGSTGGGLDATRAAARPG